MSKADNCGGVPSGRWTVVAHHDWGGPGALETTLRDVLDSLEDDRGEERLYQYIDTESVRDVIAPDADRGASAVCFEYRHHEIRLAEDGTVAVR